MKKAFITGISGQDGSYLAEFLLEKGYEVHGMVRRSSSPNRTRIDHLWEDPNLFGKRVFFHYGDVADGSALNRLLRKIKPDEIYHLGAQSHVRISFDIPEYTSDVTGVGTIRLLEAIRESGIDTRFFQASSSEMYGKVIETPQKETTPFYPRSPYACAKVFSYWVTLNYREAYQIHASNGILFNHESPRRGEAFVTRKITRSLARILAGKQEKIALGNINAKRDWGYAKDYVEAMWLMLQQPQGDDYVIATGETHEVREFLDIAFRAVGRNYEDHLVLDPLYYRPTEVDALLGDPSKANRKLGWKAKLGFEDLVLLMLREDLKLEGLDPKKWIKA